MRGHFIIILFLLLACALCAQQHEQYTYAPRTYSCWFTEQAPRIDGKLDEPMWMNAPKTSLFTDIEGNVRPKPYYDTYAKMRWDSSYFYIAATLQETDLWATYGERDMVIFHENDFEVFIDPDGDSHHYYELEINARNTIWDLMLTKPYRNGGKAIDAWDIRGIRHAVHRYGTLNEPSDQDEKWTVEIALPWSVLEEAAAHPGPPRSGETWRVNFSRVHWRTEADPNGGYRKVIDPETGKPYPEFNWVWSPQGAIAMHQPETWGVVLFTESETPHDKNGILAKARTKARWTLWQHYYRQKEYFAQHGYYASAEVLGASGLRVSADRFGFTASLELEDGWLVIKQDGHITWHQK